MRHAARMTASGEKAMNGPTLPLQNQLEGLDRQKNHPRNWAAGHSVESQVAAIPEGKPHAQ
jgi:hypothetical protein